MAFFNMSGANRVTQLPVQAPWKNKQFVFPIANIFTKNELPAYPLQKKTILLSRCIRNTLPLPPKPLRLILFTIF